jgi:23S rRNA (cytosine1962-C5)-methyltransferase
VSGAHGEPAETSFRLLDSAGRTPDFAWLEAEPLTGRTHQIRVHAAEHGFPILGDTVYGGSAWSRVCLHAADLSFKHPETGATMQFSVPEDFTGDARLSLRAAILERGSARLPTETVDRSESEPGDLTNAFRLIHGASDGWPGWYVDRLGDYLLSQSERELNPEQMAHLQRIGPVVGTPIRGAYHKRLSRYVRGSTIKESSPQRVRGEVALERFVVCENGVKFELSFAEGYSVGLFLDQRDNRRRLLTGHIAAGFALPAAPSRLRVLNTFAYTCGFSVCAALAGGETTSLDLSKKYLDWGRRNFTLNGLDPTAHNVIYGDTFDWLKRFAKKGRVFDVVILDPPTFSQSKAGGAFRAEKDYGRLLTAALGVLCPGGVLLCSTNAADWPAEEFVATVQQAARGARRGITQHHYAPQPPDFPARRAEPAYLKTMWLRFA